MLQIKLTILNIIIIILICFIIYLLINNYQKKQDHTKNKKVRFNTIVQTYYHPPIIPIYTPSHRSPRSRPRHRSLVEHFDNSTSYDGVDTKNLLCNDFFYDKDLFNFENDKDNCKKYDETTEKVKKFYKLDSNQISGEKISNVYDRLISNDFKTLHKETKEPQLFTSTGQYDQQMLKPDQWGYKEENIMNGGEIENGLYPNDNGLDDHQLY